jgi:hypothetical protein
MAGFQRMRRLFEPLTERFCPLGENPDSGGLQAGISESGGRDFGIVSAALPAARRAIRQSSLGRVCPILFTQRRKDREG